MSGHLIGLLTLRSIVSGQEWDVGVILGETMYGKGAKDTAPESSDRPITDLGSLTLKAVALRIVEAHPEGTLHVGATAAGAQDACSPEGEPVSQPEGPLRPHETCDPVGSIAEGLLGWECSAECPRREPVLTLQEFD